MPTSARSTVKTASKRSSLNSSTRSDKTQSPPKTGSALYKEAGVNTDLGATFCKKIGKLSRKINKQNPLHQSGGFSGAFPVPTGYRHPVLISGTDGVGTKLRLAIDHNRHEGIGQDLVAMCVNDILTCGAQPLFFLDYFATAALNLEQGEAVLKSIVRGCEIAGCALVGGETAEMPGLYSPGDYDLAGFAVGIVERDAMLGPHRIEQGDAVIALPSSGLHANGYSLVRKILEKRSEPLQDTLVDGTALLDALLTPTKIYARAVSSLIECVDVRAFAHITGGGFYENMPRILPEQSSISLDLSAWTLPPIFDWLMRQGDIPLSEMYSVFNCGIGMIACVPQQQVDQAIACLEQAGEPGCLQVGEVISGKGEVLIA